VTRYERSNPGVADDSQVGVLADVVLDMLCDEPILRFTAKPLSLRSHSVRCRRA